MSEAFGEFEVVDTLDFGDNIHFHCRYGTIPTKVQARAEEAYKLWYGTIGTIPIPYL